MTVSSTTNKLTYNCDGLTQVFPYTFRIFAQTDLSVVLKEIATGIETTLTLTTHYTVSGVGVSGGGNVTTVATYSSAYTLTILRSLPLTQLTDYETGGAFPADDHEDALDKLTMICQQLDEELDRSLKLPVSSAYSDLELPEPEADKYLRWNTGATALENAELVALGDLTTHNNAATPHITGGWYADNAVTGPVLLASTAEVAAGNDASKVVTPATLGAVWQYDEYLIPAGAFIESDTNGATLDSQEYPVNKVKIDYAEFGQNLDEEAIQFQIALPRTWDQVTLQAKPLWMPSYGRAVNTASVVCWGFQAKPWTDGYNVDINFGSPPAYVTDTFLNAATGTRYIGAASSNFATAVAGSDNALDIRVTRKNAGMGDNNASAVVWLTGVLVQIKRAAACVGW